MPQEKPGRTFSCFWCFLFDLQELTEEGLPFLILFHLKEDTESLEKFQQEVTRQLISEKGEFMSGMCILVRSVLDVLLVTSVCPPQGR